MRAKAASRCSPRGGNVLPAGCENLEGMTDVTPVEEIAPERVDEGDHDRFAHVVYPASAVMEAMISGTPCTALCGKRWVPSRDPKRYPVCPTCKQIVETFGYNVPAG